MRALFILAWRDDVGAYVIHSYPDNMKGEVDGQDLMNIYNQHRFRSTDKNFQMLKRGALNLASYYSGGYQSNYIGKPNFCVTLLLEQAENPVDYEKVLIKVTNNLLTKMESADDFDYILMEIFEKLDERRFDEIKIDRSSSIQFEEELPKKTFATTSSATLSDEEKIFADLMDSDDFSTDSELDSKMADFEKSSSTDPFSADPFSGGGADPFGGGGGNVNVSRDAFAENPFGATQKPNLAKAFGIDEAIGTTMFEKSKTTAAEIIARIDKMDASKPQKPADLSDKDTNFKYLAEMVDYLEEKVRVLSSLASQVRDLEKGHDEKDALIGKLLLLIKGN